MRIRRGLTLAACALALLGGAPAAAHAVGFESAAGLTVTSVKQLDARLYALTVRTAAVPATLNIRVLLPAGYEEASSRRYPVLYLLHGTSGTAADWTAPGNAEQATDGRQLIVVMPDIAINDGGGGWCTNWPNGAQSWLTFHLDQLIPWVQANLRTIDLRGERAIAGLSQGGFCSLSYAALRPDLFGEALSFSGAPDIAYDPVAHLGAIGIINATEVGLDGVPPDTFFGNPVTDYLNWAAHDPATLAANLRNTKLYIYFGNGLNGPYDTGLNPGANLIEGAVYQDNLYFHRRLEALGITPAVYDSYGPGTHSWPYWNRDLSESIGPLMDDFAQAATDPRSFSYASAAAGYSVYGWSVSMHRLAGEFSTLTVAGAKHFALSGSGSATVTTPAVYVPGARYRVTTRSRTGTSTTTLAAGAGGALTIEVPLGPPNTMQEYTLSEPPLPPLGTAVYRTRVSIARAAG